MNIHKMRPRTAKNTLLKWGAKLLCSASLCAVSPLTAMADIQLVFGTYAADKPTETVRQFKPFLTYLSKELTTVLGEPVSIKMHIAPSYDEGINDLVEGHVDFSRFGPASYVTAKAGNPNIEIIAMESEKGSKTFKGVIATHKDSDISNLASLAGHRFAFGDPLSTIGRYLAQSYLIEHGVYGKDLKDYAFLGRHDRVGAAVGSKEFDAGALKIGTFDKLVAKNVPIKILFDFDNVTKPWIAKSELDPVVLNAMRKVFLDAHDPKVLKNVAKSGFLMGEDSDYAPIRAAIQNSANFD
ncbi:PhnD/SsuA/transferrin family substrate-binding protein [Paramylibacter kogurei]|nr:PhnD/SsuA/transferrin family substrate-binding protein [Amylibacter kogurei]